MTLPTEPSPEPDLPALRSSPPPGPLLRLLGPVVGRGLRVLTRIMADATGPVETTMPVVPPASGVAVAS